MSYQSTPPSVNPPSSTWDDSRLGWLGIASFPGFGPSTLRKLQKETNKDGEKAWKANPELFQRIIKKSNSLNAFLKYRAQTNPTILAKQIDHTQIRFLLPWENEFPQRLRDIDNSPGALFIRGSFKALTSPTIAIVGTRSVTTYGKQVAQELASACARNGITVISGLALGIDGIAHEATLDAQGRTIAVLGSGLDDAMIYPRQHFSLAKRILDADGGIISESAPMYDAMRFDFPLRNRLISGLSQAVLIIEAAEKSGSLITAHLAAEQGKDVMSVPGPITSTQSRGTNRLLRQGAIPCTNIEDILEVLHLEQAHLKSDNEIRIPEDPKTAAVLSAITGPIRADDLARALCQPITDIAKRLTYLELQGYIVSSDRRTYSRTTRR